MAKQTISKNQLHALEHGSLVDFGKDDFEFKKVYLKDLKDTLAYIGSIYRLNIAEEKKKTEDAPSGKSSDNLVVQKVKIFKSQFSVEITGDKYVKYISEGVDGWGGPSKGGKYKFKGTQPKGGKRKEKGEEYTSPMIKSIEDWIERNANLSRVKDQSSKETITKSAGKQAITAAFMIRRQGISPKKFLIKAKSLTAKVAEEEFGKALKVDIINNLTK